MKDYIEERAVEIAYYIIEHKATVRQTAKEFGVSKSTIHIVVVHVMSVIKEKCFLALVHSEKINCKKSRRLL